VKRNVVYILLLISLLILPWSAGCAARDNSVVVPFEGSSLSAVSTMWNDQVIPLLRERVGVSTHGEPRIEVLKIVQEADGAIEGLTLVSWIETTDGRRLRVSVLRDPGGSRSSTSVAWNEAERPPESVGHLPAAQTILRELSKIDFQEALETFEASGQTYEQNVWLLNPGSYEPGSLASVLSPSYPIRLARRGALQRREHEDDIDESFSYFDLLGVRSEEVSSGHAQGQRETAAERWSSAGHSYVVIPLG